MIVSEGEECLPRFNVPYTKTKCVNLRDIIFLLKVREVLVRLIDLCALIGAFICTDSSLLKRVNIGENFFCHFCVNANSFQSIPPASINALGIECLRVGL